MPARAWLESLRVIRVLLVAFVVSSLFVIASPGQTQQPIFSLPVLSSTSVIAGSAMGDFNGDGQVDVAYISSTTAITVLLNQGANNPANPVVTGGLTCTPQSPLVAADMNKETRFDLIFTCKEGYVVVLFGNGDGTFQTPMYYAVAGVNTIASPVDLNGDGYPDIAVTTVAPANGTPSVVVLLNQGTGAPGTLLSPTSYPPFTGIFTGPSYSSILTGDFNGDGKQDIFVVGGSVLEVFYGNGDGTLQAAQLVGSSTGASSVIAAMDVNEDGITDIAYIGTAATSESPQSLQVILGSSNGQFTQGTYVPLYASQVYQAIVPFEATSNSKIVDLALIGSTVSTISLGDGTGYFVLGPSYGITGNPVMTQPDSSGDTNLLFAQGSQVPVVTGNGDGTFQAPPSSVLEIQPSSQTIVTADLNGDGLTDVLSIDAAGNFAAALGRGNGRFVTRYQVAATGEFVVAGDFNGDGKTDAVTVYPGVITPTGTEAAAQFFFHSGNGDGTFQASTAAVDLQVAGTGTPVAGDFNGDGKLDLIIPYVGGSQSSSGVIFLAGNGDGTFATPVSLSVPATSISIVADVNNDGRMDIVGENTVDLGNGDGTFTQQPLGIPGRIFVVSDLNGDGKPDLVIGNDASGFVPNIGVYAGNGDGSFQTSPLFTTSFTDVIITSVSVGDVNGDGNLDLLVQCNNTNNSSVVAVFFGDGHGNFTADTNTYSTGPAVYFADVISGFTGRLNNQAPGLPADNKLDYLIAHNGAVTSFLNQLNPAPTPPPPLPSNANLVFPAGLLTPARPITLYVGITGQNPTGTVTFTANGASLGTVTLVREAAQLVTSFPSDGTYTVTATYSGDSNNLPSSATLSLPIARAATTMSFGLPDPTPRGNRACDLYPQLSGSGSYGGGYLLDWKHNDRNCSPRHKRG
jgi:Bacterial Ig-like domain (group 3)/FG-GAP-like repeat